MSGYTAILKSRPNLVRPLITCFIGKNEKAANSQQQLGVRLGMCVMKFHLVRPSETNDGNAIVEASLTIHMSRNTLAR